MSLDRFGTEAVMHEKFLGNPIRYEWRLATALSFRVGHDLCSKEGEHLRLYPSGGKLGRMHPVARQYLRQVGHLVASDKAKIKIVIFCRMESRPMPSNFAQDIS